MSVFGNLETYLRINALVTEGMLMMADGKLDEAEEDRIAELVAPELAKLYPEHEGSPEEWPAIRLLFKVARKTIGEIEKKRKNTDPDVETLYI